MNNILNGSIKQNMEESTDNQYKFKFIVIPEYIHTSTKLKLSEKYLLSIIYHLEGKDGCYATNKFLAKEVDMTEASLANTLTKLRKAGFIETVKFDGRNRWIKISKQAFFGLKQPSSNDESSLQGFTERLKQPSSNDESSLHRTMNFNNIIKEKEEDKDRDRYIEIDKDPPPTLPENQDTVKDQIDFKKFLFPEETKEAYQKCLNPKDFQKTVAMLQNQYSECPEALKEALIDYSLASKPYSCRALRNMAREKAEEIADKGSNKPKEPTKEQKAIKEYTEEMKYRIKALTGGVDSPETFISNREIELKIHELPNKALSKLEPHWSKYQDVCEENKINIKQVSHAN